ncbi:RidA family protein [Panacibacter ginsenosidivorans]|uniref:RidA family protein n=1 Tax=Panacibacter ginsenosidivorans TaxID=1813871 RepID=A0A5B8V8I1_9BACT|nr:RidA family protein [Panacibacter ginsenosidivorans]QEC67797.1 RidA family protein [Panacibacter ginsenosidivorans]
MKFIASLLFFCFRLSAFSQTDTSIIKFNNPAVVYPVKGYSQTASVDLGTCTMLVISGQVAFDKNGNLVGKDDLSKQTEQIFSNIKSIVEDAGGSMNQILKLNFYLLDVSQIQSVRNARDKFINTAQPPASTLVQVSKLFRDDVLIEIDATAIIPKKK